MFSSVKQKMIKVGGGKKAWVPLSSFSLPAEANMEGKRVRVNLSLTHDIGGA